MSEGRYEKPLPGLEGLTAEFYAWCRSGELRFQRCEACGTWRHVPRPMCAECGSTKWQWQRSSGRGRVFTWTTTAMPLHPAFRDSVPYATVVVETDEGVRIVSQLLDCSPEEIAMDMPVEVVFDAVTDAVTLPKFRRV